MLRPLWRGGHRYFKAGVVLNDLVPMQEPPRMLFVTRAPSDRRRSWWRWTG